MSVSNFNAPPGSHTVSAAELRRNFGEWQERAFVSPVIVARHGKPRLVLSSTDQFFERERSASSVAEETDQTLASAMAALPNHIAEGFLVLDRDLVILAVNRVFEDLTGRGAARLVGRSWLDAFPEAQDSAAPAHFRHALRTGAPVQFESLSMLVEGRHYRVTAFPHAGGLGVLIANRTHEALMAAELEEARSLASACAMAPSAGHLQINPRALIVGGSRQVQDILGFDFHAHPLPLADIAAPEQRAALMKALEQVLTGGASCRLMAHLLTKAGDVMAAEMSLASIWRAGKADGAMAFLQLHAG